MNTVPPARIPSWLAGLVLFFVTLALYWPVVGHQFLTFDDRQYVVDNPWVTQGISFAGLRWAATSFYASNWHPLTWLSHMLDWSLYGRFAGGHLLTNAILHSFNTLLMFLVLKRMTKSFWPSLLVAALFGWHPLHVESVAWLAERKDVLSTFFLLLTLAAYMRYTEKPSTGRYAATLALFALGLMSKPMLVTLPGVLLLLDYWPLNRVVVEHPTRRWLELLLEKVPFFALSAGACLVTLLAQSAGGAVSGLEHVAASLRLWNALASYTQYLQNTVWPTGLCIFYPLPLSPPVVAGIVSAGLLAVITGLAFAYRKRKPWVLVGWLWYLGMLVPVIGLVQVGSQALADRYTYVPLTGIFIAVIWSVDHWWADRPMARKAGQGLAVLLCVVCLVMTRRQLAVWQDSVTLFSHAVAVTHQNRDAEDNLGVALVAAGRGQEAVAHYLEAIRIDPDDVFPRYNLGMELTAQGKFAEATVQYSEALKRNPRSQILHNGLGEVLARQGELGPAIEHFREASRINPQFPQPYLNLGLALQKQGATAEALTNYKKALELNPAWLEALNSLARLLATARETNVYDPSGAAAVARYANELSQYQSADYLATLALTLAVNGDFTNAVRIAESAQKLAVEKSATELAQRLANDLKYYRTAQRPPPSE